MYFACYVFMFLLRHSKCTNELWFLSSFRGRCTVSETICSPAFPPCIRFTWAFRASYSLRLCAILRWRINFLNWFLPFHRKRILQFRLSNQSSHPSRIFENICRFGMEKTEIFSRWICVDHNFSNFFGACGVNSCLTIRWRNFHVSCSIYLSFFGKSFFGWFYNFMISMTSGRRIHVEGFRSASTHNGKYFLDFGGKNFRQTQNERNYVRKADFFQERLNEKCNSRYR